MPGTQKVASIMTPAPHVIGVEQSLDDAMRVMETAGLRHLPVLEEGRLVGLLSDRDLLGITGWLHAEERRVLEAPSGQVGHFVSSPVITVGPEDSLMKAALRLTSRRISCLPVVANGELVGILSETDFLKAFLDALEQGKVSPECDAAVSNYMTSEPITVDGSTDAEDAMELMREKRIRHLLVVDAGELVGVVSERDFLMALGMGTLDNGPIRDTMSEEPVTLSPSDPVSKAARILASGEISALPLLDEGRLAGILTLPDLLAPCLEALVEA